LGHYAPSGGSNVLNVYYVRLTDFSRENDPSEGVFEDTFTLEIYAQEEPAP